MLKHRFPLSWTATQRTPSTWSCATPSSGDTSSKVWRDVSCVKHFAYLEILPFPCGHCWFLYLFPLPLSPSSDTSPLTDPSYLEPVPNLDGGEGHSEHILFGTNVDLSAPSEDGPTQPTPGDGSGGSQDDLSGNEPPVVEQPHPPASADGEIDRNDPSESGTPPQELGQDDAKRDRQDFKTDLQLQENHD